jgi:P-type Ca2+ transporter type 2C
MNTETSRAWHVLSPEKALETLGSDRRSGLSTSQVTERQQQYGPNELKETGGRTKWDILIDQFKNIMLILLIVVALISGGLDLMDLMEGKSAPNSIPFKDTIAILSIVFLNGLLGYLQESQAEKALAALKSMSSPNVRVLRDGKMQEIAAPQLVPGDVMLLEAGVQVAADGRLLDAANLQIRESALTGEAHAVEKQIEGELAENTPLGDRLNLVFQGTEVLMGRGMALVTRTGMATELGKIATLLQSVESEPTPLQKRMDQLSRTLVFWAMVLVAIVVIGGSFVAGWNNFRELLEVGLSMAVAVVPEGLPAVITVTLALGTQRMVRRQALIRRLPAVETLGSVTTICSDKTGTLTQNKMVVQSVLTVDQVYTVTGQGYAPEGDFFLSEVGQGNPIAPTHDLKLLMIACALCNDAALQKEQGEWAIIGDPTEGALLTLAAKANIWQAITSHTLPRVGEFPFSSERKRMSVIVRDEGANTYILLSKGSPELVLERCQSYQSGQRVKELGQPQRSHILGQNNHLASNGLRVLGFAYKLLEKPPATINAATTEATEQGMTWLGLVDMLDAPRPEVRDAVARCRSAGIRPIMITGDHQLTAKAIATDLGIADASAAVLTGQELERLSQEELQNEVGRVGIYARVAPEHKLRIVQALQNQGRIVAMTGDGVNDAPALKQAAIGIAMGITGTDVSKEASDMVLQDDNFATIVAAVEEGRVVYTNIRRFIKYILGSNIGEVLTIAAAPLLGLGGVPLTPLQILWMNLVTDGLPALALAVEPAEPNVMRRDPYDPGESIFARGLGLYMIRVGIVLAVVTIALMVWAYGYTQDPQVGGDPERWKTMVFTTLCLSQMGHAMAVRSNSRLTAELNPFSNPFILIAVTLTSILQLLLIYVEPLRNFFGTHILSLPELGVCAGASMLVFVWVEMEKLLVRNLRR